MKKSFKISVKLVIELYKKHWIYCAIFFVIIGGLIFRIVIDPADKIFLSVLKLAFFINMGMFFTHFKTKDSQ